MARSRRTKKSEETKARGQRQHRKCAPEFALVRPGLDLDLFGHRLHHVSAQRWLCPNPGYDLDDWALSQPWVSTTVLRLTASESYKVVLDLVTR